jgi:DNA repair protein SbcC/Rad50
MRPHRLVVEALGPYRGRVEVDFDRLADEGLFLIHGATGSGKTFLLDALSFALYGDVPGPRGKHTLRSDHAERRAAPSVELEFSVHGRRYLVRRVPGHSVPKKRGDGFTDRPPKASLCRYEAGEWVPVSSAATETTREVEQMVGLTARQFQQVILLPQGQFEQVLRADSSTREELLKTLFDTVLFEGLASWLDERAKEARGAVDEQTRAQQVRRAQAAREWETFVGEDGARPTCEVPADQAALDSLVTEVAEVVASARAEVDRAEKVERDASRHQREVDLLAERWDRRACARQRLSGLDEDHDAIEAARVELGLAERAERLRSSLDRWESCRREAHQLDGDLYDLLEDLARARAVATSLPTEVAELVLDGDLTPDRVATARSALAAHQAWLGELQRKSAVVHEARATAGGARAEEVAWREAEAAGRAEAQRLDEEATSVSRQVTDARRARDQLAGLADARQRARARADAAAQLVDARRAEADARRALDTAQHTVLDARQAELDLRQRRLDGMAAELAAGLRLGEACPVCGSADHPHPAEAGADAVTAEQVHQAAAAVAAASEVVEAHREALVRRTEQVAVLRASAGPDADDAPAASEAADRAEAAWVQASALAATVAVLERAQRERAAAIERHRAQAADARAAAAVAAAVAAREEERAQRLAAEVEVELGVGLVLDDAVAASADVADSLTALDHTVTARREKAVALDALEGHLRAELAASPFAAVDGARAALTTRWRREQLATRIAFHDDERAGLVAVLESPELSDLPDERPDAAAAERLVDQASARRVAAIERQKGASDALGELRRLAAEHRAGEQELHDSRVTASLVGGVADRCNGRLAPKVSLQRWVLAAYLDDICRFANVRLGTMTGGRYQLRVHREIERGGKGSGLGLRVLDAYTGDDREVSTLSGGETFQASLALALGVADAVQSHSGGVQLDALFIDEGFGTLDAEALQLALDELDRLREGGRMVGVISHVGALRERIRVGVEVTRTDQGSTVEVGSLGSA